MQFKETSEEMKQTGEQVTIERLLPLATLTPGKYSLEIVATDTNTSKTVSKTADFSNQAANRYQDGRQYRQACSWEVKRSEADTILQSRRFGPRRDVSVDLRFRGFRATIQNRVRQSRRRRQRHLRRSSDGRDRAVDRGRRTSRPSISSPTHKASSAATKCCRVCTPCASRSRDFLPTIEQHVRINPHVTTVVRVQLESMFASLDALRRAPSVTPVESDDWKWVLRSASATRPVLQWVDDDDANAERASNTDAIDTHMAHPRARLDFTDGARRPGSPSGVPSAPATSFAYDQRLGNTARLLMAGQVNYMDDAPGGGIATIWLPTGSLSGPQSTMVLREAKLGPDGQTFRGVRLQQAGSVGLGDRLKMLYSGEYVMVGLDKSAMSLRPRLELECARFRMPGAPR